MKQITSFILSIFLISIVHAEIVSASTINAKVRHTVPKSKGMVAAANLLQAAQV